MLYPKSLNTVIEQLQKITGCRSKKQLNVMP